MLPKSVCAVLSTSAVVLHMIGLVQCAVDAVVIPLNLSACNTYGVPDIIALQCVGCDTTTNVSTRWLCAIKGLELPSIPDDASWGSLNKCLSPCFSSIVQKCASGDSGIHCCQLEVEDSSSSNSQLRQIFNDNLTEVNCSTKCLLGHDIDIVFGLGRNLACNSLKDGSPYSETNTSRTSPEGTASVWASSSSMWIFVGVGLLVFFVTMISASATLAIVVCCQSARRKARYGGVAFRQTTLLLDDDATSQ